MVYDAKYTWNKIYGPGAAMSFPAEGVIRIFKGSFPKLTMPKPEIGQTILDVGCGDGRHLPFFESLGLKATGVEITPDVAEATRQRLAQIGVSADVEVGWCGALPFSDHTFDYLLTWNSCYYMSVSGMAFSDHVADMARIIKPGGWIVASIPKKSCFIFWNSLDGPSHDYKIIADDYFGGGRNGEVMWRPENRESVESAFRQHFDSFCHADIDMSWFGLDYHWHVFAARLR